MAQVVLDVSGLPGDPLDAARHFHVMQVPMARDLLSESDIDALAIVFESAGKPHQGWQLAVVQALAREAAPKRVNGLAGGKDEAIIEALGWLAKAPGITGQLLAV